VEAMMDIIKTKIIQIMMKDKPRKWQPKTKIEIDLNSNKV
jgi:hypothetical protein